ncbi:MAG: hypothetical protein ABL915_01680 [Gallionella sp.]
MRENWLNPDPWVDWLRTPAEEQAGYPLRPVAKEIPHPNPLMKQPSERLRQQAGYSLLVPQAGEGTNVKITFESELKKRTLTNLYNARPAWLSNAHQVLDAAVAAAYGWTDYTPAMSDDEILRRLLALNLERAG